jgi:hypothetical protein
VGDLRKTYRAAALILFALTLAVPTRSFSCPAFASVGSHAGRAPVAFDPSTVVSHYLLKSLPPVPNTLDLASTGGVVLRDRRTPIQAATPAQAIGPALADVPLASLLVKPGHVVVRDAGLVKKLAGIYSADPSTIRSSEGAILLDVITSKEGIPIRVEARDAHHRLMALYHGNPKSTLGDVMAQTDAIQWLVNGRKAGTGETEPNKFPVHGVPIALLDGYDIHVSKKAATLKMVSNSWELGSRTSLAMATKASLGELVGQAKVAVHFVPPGLTGEGLQRHLADLKTRSAGFDQVVLIPERPTTGTELEALKAAVKDHADLNLYIAPLDKEHQWPGNFSADILHRRIQQLVGAEPVLLP